MSFEMLKSLAQAYGEQKKKPPRLPKKVQTIEQAYKDICTGEDPWTALGNFTNAWYGYAKHIRSDLVNKPLARPEQETEYTHRWAAFCTASTEFLCEHYAVPCPDWTHDPYYTLEAPWWYTKQAHSPSMRKHLIQTTPASFARRNIFCTNRLFQNKYETYEWICEAIEQGLKNTNEIHDYVRRKEASIYGT
jgi:hypothetical protein